MSNSNETNKPIQTKVTVTLTEEPGLDAAALDGVVGGAGMQSGNLDLAAKGLRKTEALMGADHQIDDGVHSSATHDGHSASAQGSVGASNTSHLGGPVTLESKAGAYGEAKAGPLGASAQGGAQASTTLDVGHGVSGGAEAKAVGGAGIGVTGAYARGAVGANAHVDQIQQGNLGHGVTGSQQTHLEAGASAEAAAQAGYKDGSIKAGYGTSAGAYVEAKETLGAKVGGVDTHVTAGVISPGGFTAGMNTGAGYKDHHVTLEIGGKGAIPIFGGGELGLKVDIPTEKIEGAALTVKDGTVHTAETVKDGTVHAAMTVKDGVMTGVTETHKGLNIAAHETTKVVNTAVDQTGKGLVKAGEGIQKGAEVIGGGVQKGAEVVGGGIQKGAEVVGGGFQKGGEAVRDAFSDAFRPRW